MRELVSVLMSTYNEPLDWIKASVESILNQTYQNFEIIIIQDNPSYQELSEYLSLINDKYENIKVIKNKVNLGLVESLNIGLKVCNGTYIARMDADDISIKTRLENQLIYLEKNDFDMVGSQIDYFINDTVLGRGDCCFSNWGIVKCLKYQGGLAHPTWFGKKEVFNLLNGYRLIDACEDYDFLCRASLMKFRLGNINEVLLKYRINENGISSTKKNKQAFATIMIGDSFKNKCVLDLNVYNEAIENAVYGKSKPILYRKIYCKVIRLVDHLIWRRI